MKVLARVLETFDEVIENLENDVKIWSNLKKGRILQLLVRPMCTLNNGSFYTRNDFSFFLLSTST